MKLEKEVDKNDWIKRLLPPPKRNNKERVIKDELNKWRRLLRSLNGGKKIILNERISQEKKVAPIKPVCKGLIKKQ